jgi:hypothetical protein
MRRHYTRSADDKEEAAMFQLSREPQTVKVYSFRVRDQHVESPRVETYKATRKAILEAGGEPLEGTEQEVPAAALDPEGHYKRVNTGWGTLD